LKLVDTTVAIDHLRGDPSAVRLLQDLVTAGEELIGSELSRFELSAGVRPNERSGLEDFFAALTWIPVEEQIARAAGGLALKYRKSHAGIDDTDYLIAATARILGADLLTTNVKHFPMFEGLTSPY
jgi:hypothetical protein